MDHKLWTLSPEFSTYIDIRCTLPKIHWWYRFSMYFQEPSARALRVSFLYNAMIQFVSTIQEALPIHSFTTEGNPIYLAKIDGYFFWDALGSDIYNPNYPCRLESNSDDDELIHKRWHRKSTFKLPHNSCKTQRTLPLDHPDSMEPLPIYKKGLHVVQILLNSQWHKSIEVWINDDKYRSHEEVYF